ncbi:MAG: hypothetical protein SCL54_05835 [Bacillota bacterium]|nr:hypothetical protein [Bacillota bacterium]
MNFLFSRYSDMRSIEDKSVQKLAEEKVKKRLEMESRFNSKTSFLIIISGVFFGILFTVFEFVLKNYDLGVFMNTMLKAGMFFTLAGSSLTLVGLYYFIKSFRV